MQSNKNTTDQQLLERGWTTMSTRLDRELPIRSKWEIPAYVIMSMTLLAFSVLSLSHQHEEHLLVSDQLAQVELGTDLVKKEINQQLVGEELDNTQEDRRVENTASQESHQETQEAKDVAQANNEVINNVRTEKAILNQNNTTKMVQPNVVPGNVVTTTVTPVKKEITVRGSNKRGIDPVIAAQLSIPIKPNNLILKEEDIASSSQQTIAGISFLPVHHFEDLLPITTEVELNTEVKIPKQRKLIPQLSVGYVYSLLGVSGYHVGFGLSHQLQKANRLSLFTGLNFTHLGQVGAIGLLSDRTQEDLGVFNGGTDNESAAGSQGVLVGQNRINNINQIGLALAGKYRLTSRFSIGAGTSLVYQIVSADLIEFDPNTTTANTPDTYADELKLQYDQLSKEIENKYRMTIDIMGHWHLSPRLSLQPYWKIQPTQSPLRVNQVGLNLNFALEQR